MPKLILSLLVWTIFNSLHSCSLDQKQILGKIKTKCFQNISKTSIYFHGFSALLLLFRTIYYGEMKKIAHFKEDMGEGALSVPWLNLGNIKPVKCSPVWPESSQEAYLLHICYTETLNFFSLNTLAPGSCQHRAKR